MNLHADAAGSADIDTSMESSMAQERSTVGKPQEQKAGADNNALLTNARLLVPAIVLAVTFVAYIGTLRYDFVYDDVRQIVENGCVHSWHFVPRYFAEHLWFFEPGMTNYYRPIFLVWLVLIVGGKEHIHGFFKSKC